MEHYYFLYLLCFLLSWLCNRLLNLLGHNYKSLPPGPTSLPIIGNILSLGDKPHKSLARLARIHGPVMFLQLGSLKTVVISSPAQAKEVMQKNDWAFSKKNIPDSVRAHRHHEFSMVFLPPHAAWRKLRKIANSEIFSTIRLDASSFLRREKVDQLISQVDTCCRNGMAVDVGQAAFNTSLNLLSNTFFSEDLVDPIFTSTTSRSHGKEFKELVWQVLVEMGKPNLSDYFPWLKWVDPQGIRRRLGHNWGKMLEIFDGLIDKRLADGINSNGSSGDVLDSLLKMTNQDPEGFNREYIRHLLLDLFVAGTDTTSNTLEWAMTELLLSPNKMKLAQEELEDMIGKGNPVKEEHLPYLPYLQAIIKETLRLHPPAPFLVPRKAEMDTKLSGLLVPKDSLVIVNVWAIGRDPRVWEDAHLFNPERFLGSSINVKGQDFMLTPFGGGRRICPGRSLAMRMLPLMLASLIHSFDWKFKDHQVTAKNVDMEENFGFTLQKSEPTKAIPIRKS